MQTYYNKTLANTTYYNPQKRYYTFTNTSCGNTTNPNKNKSEYLNQNIVLYQIAGFKNYETQKYEVRFVYINSKNTIVNYKEFKITKEDFDLLKNKVKSNRIKIYPVDTLKYIDLPRNSDIMRAKSCLL